MVSQLNLEEEVSAGGHTTKGSLRGPLQIGDHLPQHEQGSVGVVLPRQVIFRPDELETGKVRGCIFVREPWLVDLRHLYSTSDGSGGTPLSHEALVPGGADEAGVEAGKAAAVEALQGLLAYMKSTKTTHGILTTYDHFIFVRTTQDSSTVELSPPVGAQDRNLTVFAALWHWARDVASQP